MRYVRSYRSGFGPVAILMVLLVLSAVIGCDRASRETDVFVRPEPLEVSTVEAAAPEGTAAQAKAVPQQAVQMTKITLLAPRPGEQVPQFGAAVRFKIEGDLPEGTQPVVFLRDATGLDTNWWPYRCRHDLLAGPGGYSCGVQYGEPRDSGRNFAVVVRLLPEAECPATGDVGLLPNGLATSEIVEVIRQ
jgi:hypothetical protein